MKTREPTAEEAAFLKAANERLKGTGFTATFHIPGSKKASTRPFRLVRSKSYLRYFESIDQLEQYATRVLDEQERVKKANVTLTMFDVPYEAKMIWSGNRASFRLVPVVDRFKAAEPFLSIGSLEAAVHKLIQRKQTIECSL